MTTPLEKLNNFYLKWKNVEYNNFGVRVYDKDLTLEIIIYGP
jgi:hypothetical protein